MDYMEANAWLRGERSMRNQIDSDPDGYGLTFEVRVAQADAAKTQQAYWIARAQKEKITF